VLFRSAIKKYIRDNGVNVNRSMFSWIQDDTTIINPPYKKSIEVKGTDGKVTSKIVDAKLTEDQLLGAIDYIVSDPMYKELDNIIISNSPGYSGAITIYSGDDPTPLSVFDGANLARIYNNKKKIIDRKNAVRKQQYDKRSTWDKQSGMGE